MVEYSEESPRLPGGDPSVGSLDDTLLRGSHAPRFRVVFLLMNVCSMGREPLALRLRALHTRERALRLALQLKGPRTKDHLNLISRRAYAWPSQGETQERRLSAGRKRSLRRHFIGWRGTSPRSERPLSSCRQESLRRLPVRSHHLEVSPRLLRDAVPLRKMRRVSAGVPPVVMQVPERPQAA